MQGTASVDTRFGLTTDEIAIRDMAANFAAEKIAPFTLRWDEDKHFPLGVFREAAALGMAGIYVRDDVGGSGLTRLCATLIFEALASACPSTSAYLSIHNMVGWMIDSFGTQEQRESIVPRLCAGEIFTSYCLTEPSCGSDAAALKTTARRDGDVYVLNGTKQFISGAGATDLYIVMARTGGPGAAGVSAFIVDRQTPGLSFGANERKMGWNNQPTRQVILEDALISASCLLGQEGQGFKIAMAGLDGGRLNIAACSVGGAAGALEKARLFMRDRRAFGKSLDEFQALQFRLADMATELEAARSFLWRAAAMLDASDPAATKFCAMAKRFCTDVGFDVANQALQLHGGYGYLADYGLEKIVRDLRVHQILEGTNEIMRLIIARALTDATR